MPADFVVNQGDTEPVFAQQILDSTGSPVNLTGATVQLILRSLTQSAPLTLTGTVSSPTPTAGIVQWEPSTADTAIPGDYQGKWQITYADGAVQSYPTDGYIWVRIEPNVSSESVALVGLPDVKDYLNSYGIDRTHDDKLLRYIYAATPIVEGIVGPVIVRTFDEWHDGGQFWVQPRRTPSRAIGTTPVFNLMAADEYRGPVKYALSIVSDPTTASIYSVMVDPGVFTIYRRTTGGGVIPFGAGPFGGAMPDAVHIVYQAGQSSVPENIR